MQDLPPKDGINLSCLYLIDGLGYPAIRTARNMPKLPISAAWIGVGMFAISTIGLIQLASVWRERR